MSISRQVRRAQERQEEKDKAKLIKQLRLSDFTYSADDKNATLSAMGPQLVDFMNVIGLPGTLKEYVHIEKRQSPYSPDKLSQLLVVQNILGYDRIESSRALNQDTVLKEKLGILAYPDPETFRDELHRYSQENMKQMFLVNQNMVNILSRLTKARYVDLHFDAKIITVYGDQENAAVGYNPHKQGRKCYHLKICTMEPFGFIVAIQLEPGNSTCAVGFVEFYKKCLAAVPQTHFVIQTVRMDSGFFGDGNISAIEGDFVFFEMVSKRYSSIDNWVKECIPEEDYKPFYPDLTIYGASFSFCLHKWQKLRDFVAVKKLVGHEDNGQGILFPKWRYQIICHNQLDMNPRQVWEDYNKRAKIELNIKDLDYDHFITKVPTGNFLSNFAYFWHCVLSYNLVLIFKNFVLPTEWSKAKTSTLRKKLINIPARLVNHSGKMVMRIIDGFPYVEVLASIKEQLLWLYRVLNPLLV
jgi:hypothetical protein